MLQDSALSQNYPHVYRYLLCLTGNSDTAADLTQETFAQAWKNRESFEGRSALSHWLYRIAHREFLQALRRRRHQISLEQLGEQVDAQQSARTAAWTDAAELRTLIGKLPVQEREVIILHYFEGYGYAEIAGIVGGTVGRVRHRLSEARVRLRQAMGEGDMSYLNRPLLTALRSWAWLPLEELADLEADLHSDPESAQSADLLFYAAGIIDSRLDRKVHLAAKGIDFVALCRELQQQSGVSLQAASSISTDRVILFCRDRPLRAVMRALSQLFGLAWRRTGVEGAYRYEIGQERQGALLEEALRRRDDNAALLALDSEMQRYCRYLPLSPAQAERAIAGAGPDDRALLENLAGTGWAPIHLYFALPPAAMRALLAGHALSFSPRPTDGQWPLPQGIAQGALTGVQSAYADEMHREDGRSSVEHGPILAGMQLVRVELRLIDAKRGQAALEGKVVYTGQISNSGSGSSDVRYTHKRSILAVGNCQDPTPFRGGSARSGRAQDPTLLQKFRIQPESRSGQRKAAGQEAPKRYAMCEDVLEAVHKATRQDLLGDCFTRPYAWEQVTSAETPLGDALDSLAGTMQMRWRREEDWLQFRTIAFCHERLAEVPVPLLERWSDARRKQGSLGFEDLLEIVQLSDAQLDAPGVAECAEMLYGLQEWNTIRSGLLRPHWRFLESLPPEMRRLAWSGQGLRWEQLSTCLTALQQQRFLALATNTHNEAREERDLAFDALCDVLAEQGQSVGIWSAEDMTSATLHVRFVPLSPLCDGWDTLGSALPASEGIDAGVLPDVAFIYTFGSVQSGFWRCEIRSNGTSWRQDPRTPLHAIGANHP